MGTIRDTIIDSPISELIKNYINIEKNKCDCPFCKEKDGFFISDNENKFKCFFCEEEGDIIDFVSKFKRISLSEVYTELADKLGLEYNTDFTEEQKKIFDANKLAARYYYNNLKNTPHAQKIFIERGLSYETMVKFGLGYDGNEYRGLEKYLKQNGVSEEIILKSNLLSKGKRTGQLFDRFRERIIFPIFDEHNNITGFGGRKTKEEQDAKYINTSETQVFKKRENLFGLNMLKRDKTKYMILCEGYMDVISLQQAGFYNAVAPLGTSFPKELADKIAKFTDTVYLAFDNDEAGTNAKLRAITKLKQNNIKVFLPDLAPYKDPDELIKAEGQEGFVETLKNAKDSYEFEINNWLTAHPETFANIFESVIIKCSKEEMNKYLNKYKEITGLEFDYTKLSGRDNVVNTIIQEVEEQYRIEDEEDISL